MACVDPEAQPNAENQGPQDAGPQKAPPGHVVTFYGCRPMSYSLTACAILFLMAFFIVVSLGIGLNEKYLQSNIVRGLMCGVYNWPWVWASFCNNGCVVANAGWHWRYHFFGVPVVVVCCCISFISIEGRPFGILPLILGGMSVGFQLTLVLLNGVKPGLWYYNIQHAQLDQNLGPPLVLCCCVLFFGLLGYSELVKAVPNNPLLGIIPVLLFVGSQIPFFAILAKTYNKFFYDPSTEHASKEGQNERVFPLSSEVEDVFAVIAQSCAVQWQVAKALAVALDVFKYPNSNRWILSMISSFSISLLARSSVGHQLVWAAVKNKSWNKCFRGPACPGAFQLVSQKSRWVAVYMLASCLLTVGIIRAIMLGNGTIVWEALVFADVHPNVTKVLCIQVGVGLLENVLILGWDKLGRLNFPEPEHLPEKHPLRQVSKEKLPFYAHAAAACLIFFFTVSLIVADMGSNWVFGLCGQYNVNVSERWRAYDHAPVCM